MPDFSQPVVIPVADAARIAEVCNSCGIAEDAEGVVQLLSLPPEQRGTYGWFACGVMAGLEASTGDS
jgi:hypothetical protein